MDRLVVLIQKVDPGANPGLYLPHQREIAVGLDTVVAIKVLEKGLKRRDELPVQIDKRRTTRPPPRRKSGHGVCLMPEMTMHL